MLPVMIATLVGVLEGVRVLPHALWAAGGALVIATMWTSYVLHRRVAEIRVDGEWARVLSVSDVLDGAGYDQSAWRVLDVRRYDSWADVTVGLTTYELARDDWPDFEALVQSLVEASMT